jgi:hypothetical protein
VRLKPVPEPPESLDALGEVRSALPLVPSSENDCCARVLQRTHVEARDEARTWITFLQALELAAEHETGYARTREDVPHEDLPERFLTGVFAARETLAALAAAGEPRAPAAVLDDVEDVVPRWERSRSDDWRADWRERVRRVLEWAVLLGLAERVDGDRYRAIEAPGASTEES